jgi:hypothetical protein
MTAHHTCCCGGICYYVATLCECSDDSLPEQVFVRCSEVAAFGTEGSIVFRDVKTSGCYEVDLEQEPIVGDKPVGPFGVPAQWFDDCEECCDRPGCDECCDESFPSSCLVQMDRCAWREDVPDNIGVGLPGQGSTCNFATVVVTLEYGYEAEMIGACSINPIGGACFIEYSDRVFVETGELISATADDPACQSWADVWVAVVDPYPPYTVTCDPAPACPDYLDRTFQMQCVTHSRGVVSGTICGLPYPAEVIAAILAEVSPVLVVSAFRGNCSNPRQIIFAVASVPSDGCPVGASFTTIPYVYTRTFGVWDSIALETVGSVTIV